jgi:hypothetical protein
MAALSTADLAALLEDREAPCLSLYQPTHRHFPENQQDPIRYKNLLKALKESLLRKYPAAKTAALLQPFERLQDDANFWNHALDGVAVLSAPGLFRSYRLPRPVPELAVVADSLHVKPLVRIVQTADAYQVLTLNREEIALYQGNRDALDPVELEPGVPRTITEALGEEMTEPYSKVSSYGAGPGAPMHHGHGSKKDEIGMDTERFFRAVDKAILDRHSQPSQLPLLLAALPEYQGVFRQLSRNPLLMDAGLDVNADALDIGALREQAWRIVEPRYHERLQAWAGEFAQAAAKGRGTGDLPHAAQAAVAGRVAVLLVEADRHIGGRLDRDTGRVEHTDLKDPAVDDLLDDIAVAVLRAGGRVEVVPGARMPTETGLAAIFRY